MKVWIVTFDGCGPGDVTIEGVYTNEQAAYLHVAARTQIGEDWLRVTEFEAEDRFTVRGDLRSLVYPDEARRA